MTQKPGISGILADFGNFFIPNVMATSIIENLTILQIFGFFTSRNFRSENSAKQAKKMQNSDFDGFLTQDYGHATGRNLMKF